MYMYSVCTCISCFLEHDIRTPTTCTFLQAMALDDSELRALFGGEDDDKENVTTPTFAPEKAAAPSSVAPGNKETAVGVARPPLQAVSGNVVSRKRSGGPGETAEPGETSARSEGVMGCRDDGEDATGPSDGGEEVTPLLSLLL